MLAALLPLAALGAKEGYKITFQANGNQDTMMLLCYYHANARYITDTAYNNGKGRYVFEDKKKVLKPGLYFTSPTTAASSWTWSSTTTRPASL